MLKYTRKDKRLKIPVGINPSYNFDDSEYKITNMENTNAAPKDLLKGKTAYSINGFITGTLDVDKIEQESYQEGYEFGYTEGNGAGYILGKSEGYDEGYSEGNTIGYASGKTDGYNEGYTQGEQDGYISGEADGFSDGYTEGKDDGIEEILTEQSDANINPDTVLAGYIGYSANNERVVGTYTGGGGGTSSGYDYTVIGYSPTTNTELNQKVQDDIAYSKMYYDSFDPAWTSIQSMFTDNQQIKYIPQLDTRNIVSMAYFIQNCNNIEYFPQLDYSNTIDFSWFATSSNLSEIKILNTPRNANFYEAFSSSKIKKAEIYLNESAGTNFMFNAAYSLTDASISGSVDDGASMQYMFQNCEKLENLYFNVNTSKAEDMSNMFNGCYKLSGNFELDLSSCRNAQGIFYLSKWDYENNPTINSIILKNISSNLTILSEGFYGSLAEHIELQGDTSGITSIGSIFRDTRITEGPEFNTSNVLDAGGMFDYCINLRHIPLYDFGNVNTIYVFATSCGDLRTMDGLLNLGKGFVPDWDGNHILDLSGSPLLDRQSCLNLFNNVYDMNNTEITDAGIMLSYETRSLLSDEDIAIATNKGWIIS